MPIVVRTLIVCETFLSATATEQHLEQEAFHCGGNSCHVYWLFNELNLITINAVLDDEEGLAIKSLGLLTRKKMIYAANVADFDLATGNAMVELKEVAEKEGAKTVSVSAQVEAELVELEEADNKVEFCF